MSTRMQQRRDTSTQWSLIDPVLAEGEIGFETDTGEFRLGDGTSTWSELSPFKNIEDLGGNLDDYIPLTQKAQDLGVATLDADGQVPASQLGNATVDLTGYATETYVNNAVSDLIGAAPGALDTLNELAAAIGDDASFFTTIDTNITNAENAAKSYADGLASNYDPAGAATTAENNAKSYADGLAVNYDASGAASTAETNANIYTDNVVGALGGNVTAVVNGNLDVLTGGGLTTAGGFLDVDFTELGTHYDALGAADSAQQAANLYTDNAISAIPPVDLSGKQDVVTGVTSTEISYLDGVTSSIQTQIDGKANSSHTHDQSDITDLATDLAAKAPLSGPTFTGTVNAADVIISGDLTVSGTTTTVNTQDLVVSDPLIYVGEGNSANLADLGIISSFDDGTYQHSGLVRDSSDNKWKLFKGVTDEPTTTVNFAQGSLDALAVGALEATSATIGDVSNTELQYLSGVTSEVQTQIDAKAPINSPTFTGTVSGVTKAMVGLGNVDNTSDANKPVSTATQTALNLKANLAGPTFSGNVTLPSTTSIGNVSATELGYLDGVTSAIQTQLGNKQDKVTNVSDTEIGYLDGVTSAIQTQLNTKASTTSPTITNPQLNISSTEVVSTWSVQVELNHNVGITGALTIVDPYYDTSNLDDGDTFYFSGTSTTLDNIPFVVLFKFDSGGGLVTNIQAVNSSDYATVDAWSGSVTGNFSEITISTKTVSATELGYLDGVTSAIQTQLGNKQDKVTNVSDTEIGYLDGVTSAIQTQLNAKAPLESPTFTGTVVLPSTVNGPSISTSVNLLFPTQSGHITLGGSQTTGDLTIGGGANRTTGAIKIGTGATTTGTKTISIGTGSTGGTTAVTIGSSSGATSNIALNGNVTLPSTTSIGNVSATELGYLDGVTSAIQTQLGNKQDKVTNVSDTEIGYLDGVTSAIQTQLNTKASTSHTHTLDNLSDVATGSPTSGQVLSYNGSQWVNSAVPAADPTIHPMFIIGGI